MARSKRSDRVSGGVRLEALEGRSLLSSSFVGVGLGYSDNSFDGFDAWANLIEGQIDAANEISGTLRTAGPSNPSVNGPITPRTLLDLGNGRVSFDNLPWLRPQDGGETSAASFLDSKGFPLGWSVTDYLNDDNYNGEAFFFIERPTDAVLADLAGNWTASLLSESFDDFIVTNALFNFTGPTLTITNDSSVFDNTLTLAVAGVSANGAVTFDQNTIDYMFISRDKSVILYVGLGGVTDDAIIGVAVREAASVDAQRLPGSYRVNAVYAADLGTAWDAEDSGAVEGLLVLNSNNTWQLEDLESHDDGNDTDVTGGTWSLSGTTVTLTDTNGSTLRFVVSRDGDSLFGSGAGNGNDFIGVATRTVPVSVTPGNFDDAFASFTGTVGDDEWLWELGDDGYWRQVDLDGISGAPAGLDDVVTWIDSTTRTTYAAAISGASGVLVFSKGETGVWSVQELTPNVPGSEDITSQLQVMEDINGTVYIIGVSADGDIVAYINPDSSNVWTFKNITQEDLAPNNEFVPAFQGELVSYDTGWGGLNLAGLDTQGNVWSVWWAPGLPFWQTDNLTQITQSTVSFVGGLTVYLTPWLGINIAGVDAQGDISAVWWVPEFGGEWRQTNLTDAFGGPALTPQSVTSYTSPWGGLNIVGFDQATGEVKVYWWAPGLTDWNITSLSQTVGTGAADPVTDLEGIVGSDGSFNIMGFTQSGELINYFWKPGYEGNWFADNVSDDAIRV